MGEGMASRRSAAGRMLVIGQGLAGTTIGFEASRRNWHVTTVDRGGPCASRVAAGMFNPMSFKRLIPTWDAQTHLDCMREMIGAMEALLGVKVLHNLPMWKVLPNAEVARDWIIKAQTNPLMGEVIEAPDGVIAPYGIGVVESAGWVDLSKLLDAWRHHLEASEESQFIQADAADIDCTGYDAVVDCRGIGAVEDPSLAGLKISPYKGEVLTLERRDEGHQAETADFEAILNCGKWLMPLGNGRFKLGASYDWDDDTLEISAEVRDVLLHKLETVLPSLRSAFDVVEHRVGLRPVARDRRPVIGNVEKSSKRFVFNGLGTRGVLIAPRWAAALLNHIETGTSLPNLVLANRFV